MAEDFQEPFPGYRDSIGGLQGALQGEQQQASQTGASLSAIRQELYNELRRNAAEQEKPEKPLSLGQKFLLTIPGAAQGYAARKRLDREEEELKLRRQQLEGAKAGQRLRALSMLQGIEQQERAQKLGSLYGAYVTHEDVLDDTARGELRGGIVRELATAGDVSGIQAFQKAEQDRATTRALGQLLQQRAPQDPQPSPEAFDEALPAEQSFAPTQETELPVEGLASRFRVKPMAGQLIIRAAQAEGVPPALALAVAEQESGGNQEAVSPAGAMGVMQLMPATARDLGVDPRDIRQNIQGGIRYLKQQLQRYNGNVPFALAAYNAGPGRVDEAGGVPNIQETRNYVARIGQRLAGLLSPANADAQSRVPIAPGGNATGRAYRIELARVKRELDDADGKIRQLLPFSNSAQGAKALEFLEKQRDNLASRRKELEELVHSSGSSEAELVYGGNLRFASPQERQQVADTLQERRLQQQREQGLSAAELTGRSTALREQAQHAARLQTEQVITPKERREAHKDLRAAIRQEPAYKAIEDYSGAYKSVEAGAQRNDGVGDLALVYGVAKLAAGDQSVVRESEFSNVENAQGAIQRILNIPEKVFSGSRLTPEFRQRFVNLAAELYRTKGEQALSDLQGVYGPQAEAYGIPFEQILPSRKLPAAQPPQQQSQQAPPSTSGRTIIKSLKRIE